MAHGDHIVEAPIQELVDPLGPVIRDIDPDLAHGFDGIGIQPSRVCTCAGHLIVIACEMP